MSKQVLSRILEGEEKEEKEKKKEKPYTRVLSQSHRHFYSDIKKQQLPFQVTAV